MWDEFFNITVYFAVLVYQGPFGINLSVVDGHGDLIVDDVKEQREIASKMLTALGYRAATVSNGESAIEYLKKHQVYLVLTEFYSQCSLCLCGENRIS